MSGQGARGVTSDPGMSGQVRRAARCTVFKPSGPNSSCSFSAAMCHCERAIEALGSAFGCLTLSLSFRRIAARRSAVSTSTSDSLLRRPRWESAERDLPNGPVRSASAAYILGRSKAFSWIGFEADQDIFCEDESSAEVARVARSDVVGKLREQRRRWRSVEEETALTGGNDIGGSVVASIGTDLSVKETGFPTTFRRVQVSSPSAAETQKSQPP